MILKPIYITLFILFGVCCSSKKTSADITAKSQISSFKKAELISKGFTPGVSKRVPKKKIVYSQF